MIEVFKTNIACPKHAALIVSSIHQCFADYRANFDLQDCDKILRIMSNELPGDEFISWLQQMNCHAEVLPGE